MKLHFLRGVKYRALGDITIPLADDGTTTYDQYSGDVVSTSDPTLTTDTTGATLMPYTGSALPDSTYTYTPTSSDPNQSSAETARLAAIAAASANVAANPPAQVTTSSLLDSLTFDKILQGVGKIATAVQTYRRTQLPNGGHVYTRIDPLTGRPVTTGGSITLGSLMPGGMTSSTMMIGVGLLAIYFMMGKKK